MSDSSPRTSRKPSPGEADPHFGTDEQMLAWCEGEKITPVKDRWGNWDWMKAWAEHQARGTNDGSTC